MNIVIGSKPSKKVTAAVTIKAIPIVTLNAQSFKVGRLKLKTYERLMTSRRSLPVYDENDYGRYDAKPKIGSKVPGMNQTFFFHSDIVVNEKHVRPPIFSTELPFRKVDFVPKRPKSSAIEP